MASDPNAPSSLAAKRAAAQEEGFLREVDEALREEQFLDQLRRYGRPLAAVIGLGLIALAAWLWWDNSVKQDAAGQSEQMTLALDKLQGGNIDAAVKDLEPLAKDGSPGSRAAAAMALAGIALEKGQDDAAASQFAAIAADATMPQPFRDLATLREAAIRFDTLKPEEVIARLKPLALPGKPYFGSAGELMAMAYLAQGKNDQAGALLAQIGKDENAPQSVRSRARQLATGLGYDGGEDAPAALAPGAAPASN